MVATEKETKSVFELLRICGGLTIKNVAEALNVTPSYVRQIETGERKPSRRIIEGFSMVFNVKPSQLLYLSEEMTEKKYNYQESLLFVLQKISELQTQKTVTIK